MHSDFLKHTTTYPTQIRDFKEWHQGIEHFGFWAIEVTTPNCLQQVLHHQQHLNDVLHPHYLRQPHITLAIHGLLADNSSYQDIVEQQIKRIEQANITPFTLKLSHCSSFSTCPYLSINDPLNALSTIRTCLNTTLSPYAQHELSKDLSASKMSASKMGVSKVNTLDVKSTESCKNLGSDDTTTSFDNSDLEHYLTSYTPHITLGFYNKSYRTADIVKKLNELPISDIEFTVSSIVFAQYKTNDIQGPYQVLRKVKLG